jgi:hypothetical protein
MLGFLRRQARLFGWKGTKAPNAPPAGPADSPPSISDTTWTDYATTGGASPSGRSRDPADLEPTAVPRQGDYRPGRTDPAAEYVAGTTQPFYPQILKTLPFYIDPLSRDFGDDLYERMLLDDQVASSYWSLGHQVLGEDVNLHPAVDDRKDPVYPAAKEICEFVRRDLEDLDGRSVELWLVEMWLASALGNRIAEKVYREYESGKDAGRLGLHRLVTKPRRNLAFVVNAYSRLIGLRAAVPGVAPYVVPQQTALDPKGVKNVLPREKFAILSWMPRDNDPRGLSILTPAYPAWWQKQQLREEFGKAAARFGTPFIWGTTPDGAMPAQDLDALGNPTGRPDIEPTDRLLQLLMRLRSGGVAAVPFGTNINVLFASEATKGILDLMEGLNRQIVQAIRLSTRDTMEAQHGSRADSETSQDVTGSLIRTARRWISRMVRQDVVFPTVLYNFGPEVARNLTPKTSISSTEHQDFSQTASAFVSLAGANILLPSMYPQAWQKLGLEPPEDDSELEALKAQKMGGGAPGMPAGGAGAPGSPAPPAPAPGGGGTLADALPDLLGGLGASEEEAPAPAAGGISVEQFPGLFGGGT